jgi:hypothetical protein
MDRAGRLKTGEPLLALNFIGFLDFSGLIHKGHWCRKRESNPRPHHYE